MSPSGMRRVSRGGAAKAGVGRSSFGRREYGREPDDCFGLLSSPVGLARKPSISAAGAGGMAPSGARAIGRKRLTRWLKLGDTSRLLPVARRCLRTGRVGSDLEASEAALDGCQPFMASAASRTAPGFSVSRRAAPRIADVELEGTILYQEGATVARVTVPRGSIVTVVQGKLQVCHFTCVKTADNRRSRSCAVSVVWRPRGRGAKNLVPFEVFLK